MIGEPRRVVDAYREAVAEAEGRHHREDKQRAAEEGPDRWGSGAARLVETRLRVAGEERYHLAPGEPVEFVVEVETGSPLRDFVFGIAIRTPRGQEVWGTNTELEGLRPRRLGRRARVTIACPELRLAPGEYEVDLAVHARDGAPYDYRRRALTLTVSSPRQVAGVYEPRHEWGFEGEVEWEEESRESRTNHED